MRIYISGAITGTTDYMERFAGAESELSAMGWEVVNPAKVNAQLPATFKWDDYMRVSLAMLSLCDAIYFIPGWRESKGAWAESAWAAKHNIMILYGEMEAKE